MKIFNKGKFVVRVDNYWKDMIKYTCDGDILSISNQCPIISICEHGVFDCHALNFKVTISRLQPLIYAIRTDFTIFKTCRLCEFAVPCTLPYWVVWLWFYIITLYCDCQQLFEIILKEFLRNHILLLFVWCNCIVSQCFVIVNNYF